MHAFDYNDAAQAIAASVTQIELAVREAQPAVEELGALIEAMAVGLAELRALGTGGSDSVVEEASRAVLENRLLQLEQHVRGSIVQLQFYDRLVQHLHHVGNYLDGAAEQLCNPRDGNADAWEGLRSVLRERLITDAQRELLDAMIPPPGRIQSTGVHALDEHAARGSIELF